VSGGRAGDSLWTGDSDIHRSFRMDHRQGVPPGQRRSRCSYRSRIRRGRHREGGKMLPDIRAVFAAFVAVIGRLMIAVATFRVAQGSRVASLQFDLARRG